MGWLERLLESWGGSVTYWSGYRSNADQKELFEFCRAREPSVTKFPSVPCPFPVATPGCSQHEYGFAVDATFFGPGGEIWTDYAQGLARDYWGLSQISGDQNHFQMYPSAEFLPWARESGDCRPVPKLSAVSRFGYVPRRTAEAICGPGSGAHTYRCGLYGCECFGGIYGEEY